MAQIRETNPGFRRIKMINGNEYDLFTAMRHFYGWKAGTKRLTRRMFNKRFRKIGKQALRGEV